MIYHLQISCKFLLTITKFNHKYFFFCIYSDKFEKLISQK